MSTPDVSPAPVSILPEFDMPVPPMPRMTEEEFVAWCDEDIRAEWVDGEVIIMSPANDDHEDLFGWLLSVLRLYVRHRDAGFIRGGNTQERINSFHPAGTQSVHACCRVSYCRSSGCGSSHGLRKWKSFGNWE